MILGTLPQDSYEAFSEALSRAARHNTALNMRDYLTDSEREIAISIKDKSTAEALRIIKNLSITKDKITGKDFCNAVKTGNIEIIEAIIAKGVDVNIKDEAGYPPLFYAQNKETIDCLVKNKANDSINANNRDALTYMRIDKRDPSVIQHFKKHLDFSDEEKTAFYKRIKELLSKELAIAKSQGKNLLVMIGEAHGVFKIYKAEKIILQVARELGIQSLYVEFNDRDVNEALKPDTSLQPFQYSTRQIIKAHKKHMHIKGVDAYYDVGIECLEKGIENAAVEPRNLAISEEVISRKKDAVLIVGSAHLKGLLSDNESTLSEKMGAKKQFHIVPIGLSRLSVPKTIPNDIVDQVSQRLEISPEKRFGYVRENAIQVDPSLTFSPSEALSVIEHWNVGKRDIKEQSEVEHQLPPAEPARENKVEAEKIHLAQQKREQEAKVKREQDLAREKLEREAKEKREHEAKEKREREAKEKREREYKEKLESEAREKHDKDAKAKREREENDAKMARELQKQFEREAQDEAKPRAEEVARQADAKRRAEEAAAALQREQKRLAEEQAAREAERKRFAERQAQIERDAETARLLADFDTVAIAPPGERKENDEVAQRNRDEEKRKREREAQMARDMQLARELSGLPAKPIVLQAEREFQARQAAARRAREEQAVRDERLARELADAEYARSLTGNRG